jgi:hypothetical protein
LDQIDSGIIKYTRARGEGIPTTVNGDAGDLQLKVDIPFSNKGLRIQEFLDWTVEIDEFFDYLEAPPQTRVRLVVLTKQDDFCMVGTNSGQKRMRG